MSAYSLFYKTFKKNKGINKLDINTARISYREGKNEKYLCLNRSKIHFYIMNRIGEEFKFENLQYDMSADFNEYFRQFINNMPERSSITSDVKKMLKRFLYGVPPVILPQGHIWFGMDDIYNMFIHKGYLYNEVSGEFSISEPSQITYDGVAMDAFEDDNVPVVKNINKNEPDPIYEVCCGVTKLFNAYCPTCLEKESAKSLINLLNKNKTDLHLNNC